MKPSWIVREPDPEHVKRLCRNLNCLPTTAAVLINRGFDDADAVGAFLAPSLHHLRRPETLRDIETAAKRLSAAIAANEKILIFGDYDTDGVTATAVIALFLEACGAVVSTYIPHRIQEGYGLKPAHIERLAQGRQVGLIVTVDCGATSHAAVSAARRAGIDVIITDHHNLSSPYPEALAVVNPKRADCPSGLQHLAGVGVAFYLMIQLRQHLRRQNFWAGRAEPNLKSFCDLVAIGTVADMVPLVNENRVLTHTGLNVMQQWHRPGLTALISRAGIDAAGPNAGDIAFRMAPRLNAAGRMDHAREALALLTARDDATAQRLADKIERYNLTRQRVERQTVVQIEQMLNSEPVLLDGLTLVLWHRDWHEGVLGIAAARIMRRYHRPVILISTADGRAKGSARSLEGFDLYEALSQCSDMLMGFGGHALAAGLQIDPKQLPEFRRRFEATVRRQMGEAPAPPPLALDAEIDLSRITAPLLDELARLEPFGAGNPQPLFAGRDVVVSSARTIGKSHLKLELRQRETPRARPLTAVWFFPDQPQAPDYLSRVAFTAGWHFWRGQRRAQLEIKAVQTADPPGR